MQCAVASAAHAAQRGTGGRPARHASVAASDADAASAARAAAALPASALRAAVLCAPRPAAWRALSSSAAASVPFPPRAAAPASADVRAASASGGGGGGGAASASGSTGSGGSGSTAGAGESGSSSHSNSHADAASPAVGYWLLATAGCVAGMIVLGGVTRLTRSGLSIVEWRPAGEALPVDDAGWAVEFEKYRATPEYARVNSRMTLDEFKPIYVMEWAHRQAGRALGVVFLVPLAGFAAARAIPRPLAARLALLGAFGAGQGAVGWWMVQSGLEADNFRDAAAVPRVSPYRLAAHLTMAFGLYSGLLWTAWGVLRGPAAGAGVTPAQAAVAARLRGPAAAAAALVGATAFSGAFVAGNDAGHAFNDWPLYAGRAVPEGVWQPALGARNLFENTATVQFDHRNLAYATLAGVGGLHAAVARAGGLASPALPPGVRAGALALGGLVACQATLGVATLMLYVPVPLGSAHQAGAVALWTAALWTAHSVARAAAVAGAGAGAGAGGGARAAGVVGAAALAAAAKL